MENICIKCPELFSVQLHHMASQINGSVCSRFLRTCGPARPFGKNLKGEPMKKVTGKCINDTCVPTKCQTPELAYVFSTFRNIDFYDNIN